MHTVIRLISQTKLPFLLFGILTINLGVKNLPAKKPGSITLLGQLSLPDSIAAQDLWGYFEPSTGEEYAVVGYVSKRNFPEGGFVLVKVTDPSNPVQVAQVHSGSGFDVKVWQSYVYTVNGKETGTGTIVDISDIESPRIVGSFPSAHNIFIAENGYMYLERPGLRI
ncbi:hypothetical protein GWO43_28090, partial [candidate division KSB1 bacterium]|nr:hypothetical protein [candidate division KSB1 bacterium]NIR71331.1 hypothetical protein [candidate division KSB1 bacterium]NIS26221.1 hypothetical protein [candidate division KSB1 bacterium]NIT74651.1 hypothetical protein [candidate division KSB1 bacterium]NIU26869.1 hypothetical protein [candidate division KSB1 bacterium]